MEDNKQRPGATRHSSKTIIQLFTIIFVHPHFVEETPKQNETIQSAACTVQHAQCNTVVVQRHMSWDASK